MILRRILDHRGDALLEYLEQMDDLLFMELGRDGCILGINESAAGMSGGPTDWVGRSVTEFLSPGTDLVLEDLLRCSDPFSFSLVATGRLYRGQTCPFEGGYYLVAELMVSGDSRVMEAMSRNNNELVTLMRELRTKNRELERANKRIEELMLSDALTGLANRRAAYQRFELEAARAQRHGHPLSLAVCDIDHFKKVNDTYGHQAGDEVLVAVATTLGSQVRKTDLAARWGGEEFVLLLPETTLENALVLAERVRCAVDTMVPPAGVPHVTLSLGLAQWRTGESVEMLTSRADRSLYRAKEGGRNRFFVDSD